MRRFLLWLLPVVARIHPKNWGSDDREYPQLWYCMPCWAPACSFVQWLCGLLVGHEASDTEWEYGGDGFVERHCRWCDESIMVPMDEEPTAKDWLRGLWDANEQNERRE